ncbi:glycosyltransferase [Lusitaniella coriacea]|uniref:glycosyltransferase n=1 Tax=Lusitaniella coriacea TaxID=1983105 RepID=UPI003CE90323
MPAISIVIPVYNGSITIQETIESVLNQTFQDIEILIINDGSNDKTLEVISKFEDPRIQVFSYSNAGLAVSRNRGIAKATGDYIAFLDADDLWTPDKLQAQWQELQENPDAAVAYSWTDYIDESSQFLFSGRRTSLSGDVYPELLVRNLLENGSNPLIRQQALKEIGDFDPLVNAAADRDMYLRLAARYSFICVPSPQILYRVSAQSMSANLTQQEQHSVAVIEKAFKQAPQSLQHLKKQSLANIYKYLAWKSLQGLPSPQKGRTATRYSLQYARHEPELLKQWKFVLKMLVKSTACALLPPRQSQALFKK